MKTLKIAIVMGFFGAAAVFTATLLALPIWVLFLAWVSYYLFGKSIKKTPLILLQMVLGILLGVILQSVAGKVTGFIGPIGFPVTVFFIIGALSLATKTKTLNSIPAWFLGLIIFFGVHPKMEVLSVAALVIPIVLGIAFAWANDTVDQLILKKKISNSSN